MYALIQYGQETRVTERFAVSQEPRILNHVVQSALRGGLDYLGCDRGDTTVMLNFREDTGAKLIDHWALVSFYDWDETELQFARESLTLHGRAEEVNA